MANRYDYTNKKFCERILLRKEIASLNSQISGIVKYEEYEYNYIHSLIMRCFYGTTEESVIKNYEKGLTPIDTFGVNTLKLYRDYLTTIINRFTIQQGYLTKIIDDCGTEIRMKGELMNALPEDEHNKEDLRLPSSISGAMVKKAWLLVRKADLQTSLHEENVINTPATQVATKEKPAQITKPAQTTKQNATTLNTHLEVRKTTKNKEYEPPHVEIVYPATPKLENGEINMNLWREKLYSYQAEIEKLKKERVKQNKKYNEARGDYKIGLTIAYGVTYYSKIVEQIDAAIAAYEEIIKLARLEVEGYNPKRNDL